ncbi:MAG: Dolichyl-phosphate mannose synthase related protein [Candidatus Beckwithbacteria bacterium GW2011_GWB1_47_15]|uniref:Dolichyl-phosphate mannose synthase related protein n=1 Tax=Candidatus Beckwithbacteria bacterium GW2011_GWB1_47_15 TaxID=1618371 RepID=A0A0G1U3Q1_9BACT|nr:MAG: dolichyl-phosphate mannose synthase-like protein [Candidatus Beckwithbacteria bacterium GW2011_GWC1_49_16]KKU35724.1 MAG: Dolichyl-phosphate mannose synthase related protein [Candidatus Beckwithbacteria bacterium GW2011_GWA1_46_30]KKU60978.1 MAG: Dolichyl-phosphate mannose synthase related protein [Candidatus Beckwithbacteria bacterium GW2011_GWB1_47_15]KKU72283.1 MAG: Dolichyl-phosphate mannose synthase related protein [Candidatus Beckwithbacteria bacterium GW2011_GWA2_47_25]OGD48907.1
MKLSIIIPAYNEAATVLKMVQLVREAKLPVTKEIIVIDDGSTDGTTVKLKDLAGVTKIFFTENLGKGAAIRAGLKQASGDYVLIQDADLEYDPQDIKNLLRPVLAGKAEVVYGSRFLGPHKNMLFWHLMGNRFLSFITNILYNTTLSDMEVGYKLIPRQVMLALKLTQNRFGFEPEVTAKLLRHGYRIFEVPISYAGREFHQGKKITWRDGLYALFLLLRYRLAN